MEDLDLPYFTEQVARLQENLWRGRLDKILEKSVDNKDGSYTISKQAIYDEIENWQSSKKAAEEIMKLLFP